MVVDGVELAKLLPREVGDVLGVAARDVLVRQAWEEGAAHYSLHGRLGRGEGALHLVEDDALVAQAAFGVRWVLELEADAFLFEGVLVESWEKGRVEVDLEEVLEVLRVA